MPMLLMGLERHGLFGFLGNDLFIPRNLVLVGSFDLSSWRKMCVMKLLFSIVNFDS